MSLTKNRIKNYDKFIEEYDDKLTENHIKKRDASPYKLPVANKSPYISKDKVDNQNLKNKKRNSLHPVERIYKNPLFKKIAQKKISRQHNNSLYETPTYDLMRQGDSVIKNIPVEDLA